MENSDARAFRRVRCPRCYGCFTEPYRCGRCGGRGTILRAKIRTGSTAESAGASSRKGRDQSANPEVSDISEAREQRWRSDAERSATSPGGSVHLTKGSTTSELQNETKTTSKGQADLLDAATMRHSGEAAVQPLFSDHEEPAPKSTQPTQSARDVSRKEDDAAAAAAARGKVPELQAENLSPLWNQQVFKTADDLPLRVLEPSVTQKLPAAREVKQRRLPRHHCRPILKGAPFIVCSGCFKLVQVPADFAASTKKMHKLRCGSCLAVLSYAYRVPARKKPYQKSIDQLRIHSSKQWADAALHLLEVLGAPRRGNLRSQSSTSGRAFGFFVGFHKSDIIKIGCSKLTLSS